MFRKITRKKLEEFIKNHASSSKTLDLGCGLSLYKKYFPNRVGFDIKPGPNVDVVGDAHLLPFADEEFDIILCSEVLEHLKDPKLAISEMKRVLKKNGKLILTTRFIYPIHDSPHDFWRFTKYGLLELFRDWELIELKEESGSIESIGVLFQRLGLQTRSPVTKFFKIVFFIMPYLINPLKFLISQEYGDIQKKIKEKNILASGYYLVCIKK